jgi:transcription termination factor Rho
MSICVVFFSMVNLQEINVNRLDALGIYELRELGRMVGVQRPTALRRDDLVAGIKARIDAGDAHKGPARGRRPRGLSFDFSKIMDNDGVSSYFNSVLSQAIEPQVRDGTGGETRAISGYMHILPSGTAVLVGVDFNGYPVATKLMRAHYLKTGDYIEGKAVYSPTRNSFVVEEVSSKCEKTRFEAIDGMRPNQTCAGGFSLGERVLFVTPKPYDRLEELAKTAKEIKSAHKIALLIDETEDSVTFLREVVDDTYLTKVNYSIQKQTIACLLALFRAKAAAEQGKNVILFVDSFNKLFKIYNNSAYPDGRIDPTQVNLAPLVDLKTFLMSSRALANGGSLTVIGFLNAPSNPIEEYLYNEFADLANKIITK